MPRLHKHIKNHIRNFGVLEIILSVAILAAFSVYVLQLFVTASGYEKKMVQLDRATCGAVRIIEQFKGSETPFGITAEYGGSENGGDHYAQTVSVAGGLSADIKISKSSSNSSGGVYVIEVNMRNSGGGSVYSLSGTKYFSNAQ